MVRQLARLTAANRHRVELRRAGLRRAQEHHQAAVRAGHRLGVPRTDGQRDGVVAEPTGLIAVLIAVLSALCAAVVTTVVTALDADQGPAVQVRLEVRSTHRDQDLAAGGERGPTRHTDQGDVVRLHNRAG
jgi:hypothetical protein